MAAYSAVVSLEQQLKLLLDSDQFPLQDQRPQLQSFHQTISSLQKSVETIFPTPKHDRETAGILETLIRDSIYQAQDAIESFLSAKSPSFSFPQITQHIDPIASRAQTLADSIRKVKLSLLDGAEEIPPPPRSGVVSRTFRIVGQETDKKLLSDALTSEEGKLQILPVTGMAGIGKTTLARSTYDDPKIKKSFPFRAWVTVSQDYHVGDILARLLNSMESRGQKAGERVYEGNDDQLKIQMHQSLYNNKYLVVIDDMWDTDTWDKVRNVLPDNKNGSRIILTTRILSVAKTVKSSEFCHEMQPLDEENSWILLCDKAFEGKPCPPHLEKTGREIAKNCGGLPLSLTVIGGLLSQEERQTEEYWQTIAEDTEAAAVKGEEAYLELLYLSFNHLPGKLKGCFLYMGAFPEDCEIRVTKLIKLWVAEGFFPAPKAPPVPNVEQVAQKSLEDLIGRNLISIRERNSSGGVKVCFMENSLRKLAELESRKEKFFHSRKKYNQQLEEDTKYQRRVSIHINLLMSLEEVYESTKTITSARSLLYLGPHHHHPLPFCLTYDLLRVLDAFTVYFVEFPDEFLQLVHLRYLSLTYNDQLPPEISLLHKLQTLMVRRQPKLIFVGVSFLPDEIWKMPELTHIWFTETDFPKVPENPPLFANLQSLTNINAASCTREVLKSMPNLKKLGMWVEKPGVVGLYLEELEELEVFKFTVLNPSPSKQVEFDSDFFLPETLRKLSLSGCGLPWEAMGVIVELPNLEVLKLRELAFNGEEWCMEDCVFEKLKFLLIEYLNLKRWIVNDSHFPFLKQLYMRHCYNLDGIPLELGYIAGLEVMELVDCSPSALESAEEIKQDQEYFDKEGFEVRIYCSYKI